MATEISKRIETPGNNLDTFCRLPLGAAFSLKTCLALFLFEFRDSSFDPGREPPIGKEYAQLLDAEIDLISLPFLHNLQEDWPFTFHEFAV